VEEVLRVAFEDNDVVISLKLIHANNALELGRRILPLPLVASVNCYFVLTVLHGDQSLDVAVNRIVFDLLMLVVSVIHLVKLDKQA